MKETCEVWSKRQLIVEIGLAAIGLLSLIFNFTVPVLVAVSLLITLIVLIVCLNVKSVEATKAIQDTVVLIKETADYTDIDYEISGITNKEINEALEKLEVWKKENNFDWVKKKDHVIYVTFSSDGQMYIDCFKLDEESLKTMKVNTDLKEYIGKFNYYMKDDERRIKIDDIQLGKIELGCISDIKEVNNKNCFIRVCNDTIVDYKILES